MVTKNYYWILGVSPEESAAVIHEAFRELAKKYHPDVVGPEGTQRFQDILEAYKHLSDPELRERYNRSLGRKTGEAIRPEPIVVRYKGPEPLVTESMSVSRAFQTVRPSMDEVFQRLLRNFTGIGVPKSERVEDLNLEVLLSPSEAAEGRVVPIGVPVFRPCPMCDGSGRNWLFPCTYCREEGVIEEEGTVRIRIPAMVRDGTVLESPIRGLGIHNFYIRLHIRIAP